MTGSRGYRRTSGSCARRSDGVAERGLAPGSRRPVKAKNLSHEGVFGGKKLPKKEPRAKYCIKWLLMLYYEGSRLNGLGSPFGFETFTYYSTIEPRIQG